MIPYRWILRGIGILVIGLLLSLFFLVRAVNWDSVRERILADASVALKAEVTSKAVEFSFFPRPHLLIHQAKLSIPGKASGTIESAAAYPKLLPLLAATVRVGKLRLTAPVFAVNFPARPVSSGPEKTAWSFATVEQQIAGGLELAASKAPGLTIVVEKGRVNLSEEDRSSLWFSEIDARVSLPPNKLKIRARCESNLWKSLAFSTSLKMDDLEGSGRIHLTGFKPQVLTRSVPHLSLLPVEEGEVNLDVTLKTKGFEFLQAEVLASIPSLTLRREQEAFVIKADSVKGVLYRDENRSTVSLTMLDLEYPRLRLSGNFTVDSARSQLALKLEGNDIDVDSTRKVALAVAGNTHTLREVFEIVKGGKVPRITFETHGKSATDLGKLENILIKGPLVAGRIFVPGAKLDLEDVSGEAVISNGILEGKNCRARTGNSLGSKGTLKLGLEKGNAPFSLNIRVEADLAELPPVLKRVVSDASFQKELNLIKDVQGKATGWLSLGESTHSIKTRVKVSAFDLTGSYGRLPDVAKINGTSFSLENSKLNLGTFSGRLGASSFSEVVARLDWGSASHMEIKAGPSSISMGEIYPWLSSVSALKQTLEKLKISSGTTEFSSLNLTGPLFAPKQWQFKTAGQFQNVVGESDLFSETVTVSGGTFDATQEGLAMTFPAQTVITLGQQQMTAQGAVDFSSKGLHLDADLSSDALAWHHISKISDRGISQDDKDQFDRPWAFPVTGVIRFSSEHLQYEQYDWHPFHVDITFTGDGLTAAVTNSRLCGISTPGTVEISPSGTSIDFEPVGKSEPLLPTLTCLIDEKSDTTGTFDFSAKVAGRGKPSELVESVQGNLEFRAKNGRIHRYGLFAKILSFLNVAEVFRGRFPDLTKEGFPYESIVVKAKLEKGQLLVDEMVMVAPSMNMVCQGTIDLIASQVSMTVLVVPLKTADWIIEKIPLIGKLISGTFMTIPVKVSGDLADPTVIPMSPSAVGTGLLRSVKRTLPWLFKEPETAVPPTN